MTWIKPEDSLPEIRRWHWRTATPFMVKLDNDHVTIAYYAKIKDTVEGRIFDIYLPPVFICSDRYSKYFGAILTNVVAWQSLPHSKKYI